MVELLIVISILALLLGMAMVSFRQGRSSSGNLASHINLRMDTRKATNILTDALLTGTEVVKPLVGGTTNFLVIKDIQNHLSVFFLRKAAALAQEPYELVFYTDTLTGSHVPKNVKTLFGKVKEIFFTPLSPGLVLVSFTLAGPNKSEIATVFEVPLKNLESVDD